MQPSVYDAILPNMPLTLTVSTEPVASFFSSSMSAGLGSGGVHDGLGLGTVEVIFQRTVEPVVGYEPARYASVSTTTRATLMLTASHFSTNLP
jgi:hypothetical protein